MDFLSSKFDGKITDGSVALFFGLLIVIGGYNHFKADLDHTGDYIALILFSLTGGLIIYQYGIIDAQGEMHAAYGGERKIHDLRGNDCIVQDQWRGPYGDVPFSSKVFQDCFFVRNNPHIAQSKKNVQLILNLNCPQMEPNRHFAIVGNHIFIKTFWKKI